MSNQSLCSAIKKKLHPALYVITFIKSKSLNFPRSYLTILELPHNMTRLIRNIMSFSGVLTHCSRATHICVGDLTIIGFDNGLSPGRRQAIIWTNAGIVLIGPFGTNFSDILIEIYTFAFKKMHLKMSSGKWWQFCLGLNMLRHNNSIKVYTALLWCALWWLYN